MRKIRRPVAPVRDVRRSDLPREGGQIGTHSRQISGGRIAWWQQTGRMSCQ